MLILSVPPGRLRPLGMENGDIADTQLTSSGYYYDNYEGNARLNGENYWNGNGWPTWIQVDLLSAFIVTGLQTQGSQWTIYWVTSLSVETGLLDSALKPIMEYGTNTTMVIFYKVSLITSNLA